MPALRSHAGGLLIVGVRPGVARLMTDWADGHGRPAAVADCVPGALELLRRMPFVAVVCSSHVLVTDETFGDRLHRRQPRTALIVIDDVAGSVALPEALEHGAVDRLVPPFDRTRLGVAIARAEEWATNSEACRRRAIVVRVNGRVRALERILARQVSAWESERAHHPGGRLGVSLGWAEGRGRIATAGLSIVALRRGADGEGPQPRLDAIGRALTAAVTGSMLRAQAHDPDWTEYCRALAAARVARVVAQLWGQTTDWLQAQGFERRLQAPEESRGPAGHGGADAAA